MVPLSSSFTCVAITLTRIKCCLVTSAYTFIWTRSGLLSFRNGEWKGGPVDSGRSSLVFTFVKLDDALYVHRRADATRATWTQSTRRRAAGKASSNMWTARNSGTRCRAERIDEQSWRLMKLQASLSNMPLPESDNAHAKKQKHVDECNASMLVSQGEQETCTAVLCAQPVRQSNRRSKQLQVSPLGVAENHTVAAERQSHAEKVCCSSIAGKTKATGNFFAALPNWRMVNSTCVNSLLDCNDNVPSYHSEQTTCTTITDVYEYLLSTSPQRVSHHPGTQTWRCSTAVRNNSWNVI